MRITPDQLKTLQDVSSNSSKVITDAIKSCQIKGYDHSEMVPLITYSAFLGPYVSMARESEREADDQLSKALFALLISTVQINPDLFKEVGEPDSDPQTILDIKILTGLLMRERPEPKIDSDVTRGLSMLSTIIGYLVGAFGRQAPDEEITGVMVSTIVMMIKALPADEDAS